MAASISPATAASSAPCARKGKHVAAFYHGTDLRNRGMIPAIDEHVELRLTSEWDLLEFDPRLHYLYLPFDTSVYPQRDYRFHTPVRICHATRNPYKGTAYVVEAVRDLSARYPVELVLLQDLPHAEALHRKQDCDIVVDQLTNAGGWGYGMSSVEALAMGLPVVTNIPEKMAAPLGQHPFVQADPDTIRDVLERLITDEALCRRLAAEGRAWVRERHDVRSVGDQLYQLLPGSRMAESPLTLSVVVISFNQADFLKRLVGQLLAQDYDPAAYEIIVVDDGSIDGSREWLRAQHEPRLKSALRRGGPWPRRLAQCGHSCRYR